MKPTSAQNKDDHQCFQALASLLKAGGDTLRLQIIRAMSMDSFGVLELCFIFDTKQSGMSHHLKILAAAGLLITRREGNSIFYRRCLLKADETHGELRQAIFASADRIGLLETIGHRIEEIHRRRAESSATFFSENAERFKAQQDLIASFSVYENQVTELLESAAIGSQEHALEIGPGAGEFLPALAQRFAQVVALDNSPKMLEQAKAHCGAQKIDNIRFECADTSFCTQVDRPFDCAVMNMVLHHTPQPSQIFHDVSRAIKTTGTLIVCDLCRHDQDWAYEACGDAWLGFEPDELNQWASDANFSEGKSLYFALRNGFQIQVRQFIKIEPPIPGLPKQRTNST